MACQLSRASPEGAAARVVSACKYWENEQTYWSCNKPIDISNVEDLAQISCDLRVASVELDRDCSVAQVGSHGEVRDGCNKGDGSGDIVEKAVLARDSEAQTYEDERCKSHDCSDSPVPVTAAYGDVDVGGTRVVEYIGVCFQRIIRSLGDVRHLA